MLSEAFLPLLITLVVEAPIVALVFRRQQLRMGAICLVTTGLTNLVMNTAVRSWASSYDQYILIGELGALVVEALVYALTSNPRDVARAFLASALANTASYAAGMVIL